MKPEFFYVRSGPNDGMHEAIKYSSRLLLRLGYLEGAVFTFEPKTPLNRFVLGTRRRRLADIKTLEVRQSIWKNKSYKVRYLCIDALIDRKTGQLSEDRNEGSNIIPMDL